MVLYSSQKILQMHSTRKNEKVLVKMVTINEQIQNIAQKKDTLCRRMYN